MRVLITGATPVEDGPAGKPLDIVIEDGEIASVRLSSDRRAASRPGGDTADTIIDASRKLVAPGLVNAHFHSHDRFDRGRYDASPLEVWRSCYNPPIRGREWTERQVYLRTVLSGLELLRAGTTTVIDDAHLGGAVTEAQAESVFRAYRDVGIRAEVSVAFSDLPYQDDLPFAAEHLPPRLLGAKPEAGRVDEIFDLWAELARRHRGRVRFVLSPSAPLRCSPRFLERVAEMSERDELPVLVHLLETRLQALAARQHGMDSLVGFLDERGLLNERSRLFHVVWAREEEVQQIAGRGARVVHCPGSNMKLGSGAAPVRAFLQAAIAVDLGSDNVSANDCCSMFEQMKLAALLSRRPEVHPSAWLTAPEVFGMATRARPGRSCEGWLAPGRPADLVLLNRDAFAFWPENNLVNQLVFAGSAADVDTVLVGGRVVLRDGRPTSLDVDEIRSDLDEMLPAIRRTIAAGDQTGAELQPYLQAAFDQAFAARDSVERHAGE